MKRFLLTFPLLLGFVLMSQKASAQWDLFADIFNQLDSTENNQFLNDFNDLNGNWSIDQFDLNQTLDELFGSLNDPAPGGALDSSYIFGFNDAIDLLNGGLGSSGLPFNDQDTILGQVLNIQDIFEMNFDSLQGIFGQYQDSLGSDPNWDVTILDYDELTESNFDVLQDTFDQVINTDINDMEDIAGIIGQLFNESLYADLEMAFGMQVSDLKYYEDRYSSSAKVFRVGSVPRFDGTAVKCHDGTLRVPIEPRWHVEASWLTGRVPSSIAQPRGAEGGNIQNRDTDNSAFTPILFRGDFAMMATPTLGRLGSTSFRLITSLGLEFGTYAPAHQNYNQYTRDNKGYATGYGPQVGSGFAATTGPLTLYTIGTISQGRLFRCAMNYNYNSTHLEAGIRYGNIINVRYSTGRVTWQDNDNRRANINHQFTIGIILNSLHN